MGPARVAASGRLGPRCYHERTVLKSTKGAAVEIVETSEVISLTERAASKIRELMAEEPEDGVSVLRIAVQGGGCSGFQYALGFDHGAQDGDHEMTVHGVDVVVDQYSAPYLQGT